MFALASVPVPDACEARTNATFEALMWALSRPGTVQCLPAPGVAGIAEALLDRECRAFSEDPALAGSARKGPESDRSRRRNYSPDRRETVNGR